MTLRCSGGDQLEHGPLPSKSSLAHLASVAGLRKPEVLVWPGGVRVVYSEERPPTREVAAAAGLYEDELDDLTVRFGAVVRVRAILHRDLDPDPNPA